MTLPGGKKLVCIGSYRMTGRRLGRGNFAKVEEAVHTVLKTKVALKIMNISEIKEEYVVRNLHREARLMSRLSHPCIVTLFETMQNGPVYYLVTELIGGGDLCSFIKSKRGGKLEEKTTKSFGRQLVSAVSYMHSLGIVHRDLKMENIMLNESKSMVKIVDFGLSNMFSGDSMLRTHCGSPEYAAPELFVTGQMYGPQVDLWSLGVILYGMVMGHLPFVTSRNSRITSQERRKHLLSQINRGLGPNHRKALASFSIEFRAMINRLLLPDPLKRISVNELARHPWLTDRNRRSLRIHGMKELDITWKSYINKEVAKLLNLDLGHVEYTLRAEPFGFLAGMYNILAHRRIQQNELNAKESTSLTMQRPATTSVAIPNNPKPVSSLTHASCCEYELIENTQSLPIKKIAEIRHPSDVQPLQPSLLRVVGTKQVSKPYNLRGNSDNKKQAQNRPSTMKPQEALMAKRRTKSEPLQQKLQSTTPTVTYGPSNAAERALKRRSEQQQQPRTVTTSTRKTNATTTATSRSSSAHYNTPNTASTRHATAAGGKPGGHQREDARTAREKTRYASASGGTERNRGLSTNSVPKRPTSTPADNSRRRYFGDGDSGSSSKQHSNAKVNRRLLNEPIARCIAGYVDKYMNVHGAKVDQRYCNVQPSGRRGG